MAEIKVDAGKFECTDEYVCWIDIMGTKNSMTESFQKAANFILKFHACITEVLMQNEDVKCYPLMDGVFLTASKQDSMRQTIDKIFSEMANLFIDETKNNHHFVIRGALAYGGIIHGETINESVCDALANKEDYKKSLLIGMAMIQAFNAEKEAPPFGVYIHESARKYKGLQGRFYAWKILLQKNREILHKKVKAYFDWCNDYSEYLKMDSQKIVLYKKLVDEYFSQQNERRF